MTRIKVDVLLVAEYFMMKKKVIVHFNAVLLHQQQEGNFMVRSILDDMSADDSRMKCKKSEF